MLKKRIALLMATMLAVTSMVGCGSTSGTTTTEIDNEKVATEQNKTTASGTTEVLFWHSMSGNNAEKLMKIVDGFNASQSEVVVVAENQGTYDESTSKFFNMNGGKGSPAVIQIGEQNLQSMIDSGLVASVTDLINEYQFDQEQLLPQAIDFYSVNDTMYAMPFNISSPVLFYNAEALKKAGIEEVPATYEEITEAGESISAANDGMKAFSKPVYGYALEQMVTTMGGFVVNNDNGRSSRATEVAYQPELTKIFTWISDLIKADQFVNYGTNFDNLITGFNQGEIAMFITTSARAAAIVENAPFEVGITSLPVFEGMEPEGVYAGGGAMCVAANLDDETNAAVMRFLEYATSAEVQAIWAGDTGYFPVNINSYETETLKKIYEEKPQLKVAADQLLNSKQTKATAGPLISLLPQLRNDLQTAEEMLFNGGDVQSAIDSAVANTNKQIETANKSIQ